jgi:hypothetical protein
MTSDMLETRRLVSVLTSKLAQSNFEWTAWGISNTLFGLQSMSSSVEEIKLFVAVLASKLKQSDVDLDAQGIANSLFGFQNFSFAQEEVKELFGVLLTRCSDTKISQLTSSEICQVLTGCVSLHTKECKSWNNDFHQFISKILSRSANICLAAKASQQEYADINRARDIFLTKCHHVPQDVCKDISNLQILLQFKNNEPETEDLI